MNTHKVTLTSTNGDKVLSRVDLGLEYPSLEAAAHAANVIHDTFRKGSQGNRVGRDYDITIEEI